MKPLKKKYKNKFLWSLFLMLIVIFSFFFLVLNPNTQIISSTSIPEDGLYAETTENWDDAIKIYTDYLAKNPNRADLWKRISDIEIHLNRLPNAAIALENAVKIEPNNALLLSSLSEIYSTNNQPREALDTINRALIIDPNNVAYLRKRVILSNWLGNHEQLEDSYKRLLKINPNDELAREGLKTLHNEKKNAKPAE